LNLEPHGITREKYYLGQSHRVYVVERDPKIPLQIPLREHRNPSNDLGRGPEIESVIGKGRDPRYELFEPFEPFEPHVEPLYAVMITRLPRTEAKRLRDQIRHHGLGVFYNPEWFLRATGQAQIPRFKHTERLKTSSFVSCGTREGFKHELRKTRRIVQGIRPLLMIVQRDGGEVLVEGLEPALRPRPSSRDQSLTDTVLGLFGQFEV
jgi:hypothetical protein